MKTITSLIALLFLISFSYSQEVKTITSIDEYKAVVDGSKGKVVLVKLYKDYKDKEFVLVFVSLDDKADFDTKLLPFLKKQGVDFTSYFGNFSNPEALMTYVDKSWQGEIPYTGFYDKEGKLTKTLMGNKTYEQFETEVKKLLD